jgi:ABC-2 type transport system ATP-binding protein
MRLDAGEVLGILGRNGSGKSTLLAALLGLRRGRRGGVLAMAGADSLNRLDVGFAAQQPALYRALTVRENLRHAAQLTLPSRAAGAAVDEAVEDYGLAPVLTTPAHRLSGGWQRMVHLAASFIHRPVLRLLDEPTVALDLEARERLLNLVRRWREDGVATLITSHYPEDVEQMCSAVVLLAGGRIVRRLSMTELRRIGTSELSVEVDDHGIQIRGATRAPRRVGQLVDALAEVLRDNDFDGSETLVDVRFAQPSLRSILSGDPEFKELLDDQC